MRKESDINKVDSLGQARTNRNKKIRFAWIKKRDEIIERLTPSLCMMVSMGLILAGLGIPTLMVLGILPVSLLLGFVGFVFAATGGMLLLFFCGEM